MLPNIADVPVLGVSDFVAVFNQTLELAYPSIIIIGELANFRVSKNRWVYFDLKDDFSSVKFFGSVYNLPGPLEDGMLLQVRGAPRLHQLYGFSINVLTIQPVGEGSIKKAAQLLEAKLKAEGLFDESRKRFLPYPPARIGLITSSESAAYHDFTKILKARWVGVNIELADVQVQGELAIGQITGAIEHFNQQANPPEVLILIRGGGSPEDLAAFSTEQVTRAVAASRIPTLVAIGHEIDISLAELAADKRASTPSNAAELLVPDKRHEGERIRNINISLGQSLSNLVTLARNEVRQQALQLNQIITQYLHQQNLLLNGKSNLLTALSPTSALSRGYVIVRSKNGKVIKSVKKVKAQDSIKLQWHDGQAIASITSKKP